LQLIPDSDDPHAIVARLVAALPAGSWLAHRWQPGSIAIGNGDQIAAYAGLARKP
jgi:hypothetical protein